MVIEANVPGVKYRGESIEEVAVPWANRYQRFAELLKQAVNMCLEACGNFDRVSSSMLLDWRKVNRIMERAVGRLSLAFASRSFAT